MSYPYLPVAVRAARDLSQALTRAGQRLRAGDTVAAKQNVAAAMATLHDLHTALARTVPGLLQRPFKFGVEIGQYDPDFNADINRKSDEYPDLPGVPVTIEFPSAVRVILGARPHDNARNAPDVLIERQTTGKWLVILSQNSGDPFLHVEIPDAGTITATDDMGHTLKEWPRDAEADHCTCDNTHEQNDTVCSWCYARGRRKHNDREVNRPVRYGCHTPAADTAVADLVDDLAGEIRRREITADRGIVEVLQVELAAIGEGACDTVVKENVLAEIMPACQTAGIKFDQSLIYGW